MSQFYTPWKLYKIVHMVLWGFQRVENWNIGSKLVQWVDLSTWRLTRNYYPNASKKTCSTTCSLHTHTDTHRHTQTHRHTHTHTHTQRQTHTDTQNRQAHTDTHTDTQNRKAHTDTHRHTHTTLTIAYTPIYTLFRQTPPISIYQEPPNLSFQLKMSTSPDRQPPE